MATIRIPQDRWAEVWKFLTSIGPITRIASAPIYEISPPLLYNDGTPIEPEKFDQVERELVEQFGGVTTVQRQFPLRGVWRGERQTYLDLIVVFTVLDLSGADVEHFFTP